MIGIPAPSLICGYCSAQYKPGVEVCSCAQSRQAQAARAAERERHQVAQRAGIAALASIPHLKRGDRT